MNIGLDKANVFYCLAFSGHLSLRWLFLAASSLTLSLQTFALITAVGNRITVTTEGDGEPLDTTAVQQCERHRHVHDYTRVQPVCQQSTVTSLSP